ncbi:MAG TPA: phospho-N-acetylmuramoyl-pentapeptide-transferase [Clostridiaceae bacterium]|jgi:phospho-N-acetylmuramoyl-pentapeptide-transferase|nr:phospho-N-acetylmuramoyl-pentapeptide-transferase [Clostridium sp.]MEE0126734.1 phospho-N-acetylmuramoyl-pentapeptide-transferase [Clostridia bacterium]HJJ12122.1 phospho-N-acetylmuramoyl-pentapeptide-transferase [Clostridiaceae bacterium]
MNFQIKILLVAFGVALLLGIIILPILRKLKVSQQERAEGPKSHLNKKGTPTMGGIIAIIAITLLSLGVMLIYYKNKQVDVIKGIIPLLFATLGFGIVGFIDDFKKMILKNTEGLKPSYKMLGLLVIAVCFVLYLLNVLNIGTDIYIPIVKTFVNIPVWIYIPFAIIVMLATTNAVNLTDGIDGLATSVTTIIIACLTVIGVIFNIREVIIFGTIVCGCNLAFLIFNLHPAKVFMGDTGSLMLGGVIAGMALVLKMPLLLILIALIPVIETLSVMIQVTYYKKTGKRIFKMTPIHHHFELSGWSENKIVTVFSLLTLVLCVVGLNII